MADGKDNGMGEREVLLHAALKSTMNVMTHIGNLCNIPESATPSEYAYRLGRICGVVETYMKAEEAIFGNNNEEGEGQP